MLSLFLSLSLAVVTSGATATETSSKTETQTTSTQTGQANAEATTTSENNYTLAYKKSVQEDKPLMVVVGAPWCPACETLKKTTLANMKMSGELDQVSVAVVDRDDDPELVNQLMGEEKMIPQIIVYSKSQDGRWNRSRLKGYQPIQPVRSLLRRISQFGRG